MKGSEKKPRCLYFLKKKCSIKPVNIFHPVTSVNSLETSTNGGFVYVGGVSSEQTLQGSTQRTVIYALSFDKTLRQIDKLVLPDVDTATPTRLRRFPGYEYLAVGCLRCLLIVGVESGKLKRLARIENTHPEFVTDLAIKGDTIYLKGNTESLVKIIKFAAPKISQFQAQPITIPPANNPPTQQSNLNQPSPNTVAMSNLVQSQMVPSPNRSYQYTANKIEFDVAGSLEKVTLSKTGKLIYAGGSIGMNLLKYENESKKYLQVKNNVVDPHSVAAEHQSIRRQICAQRTSDIPGSHVERLGRV